VIDRSPAPHADELVPWPPAAFDRFVITVARHLLNQLLVRDTREGRVVGRIVETEAYLAHSDPPSHAYPGPKPRNQAMFGPPGHAYVYAIHARWCCNIVTEPAGSGSAVLLRAVEPIEGIPLMQQRRPRASHRDLTRGPARLCEAFAIDRHQNGRPLIPAAGLWIAEAPQLPEADVGLSPRIGVTSGAQTLLRFFDRNSRFVSR
jgi:DNA-3-methyladenine glycosylase